MNLYLFVINNPLTRIDLLGLDPVGEWISRRYWRDWWLQLAIWDSYETAFLNDGAGNTMAQRTRTQMDTYYRELARKNNITAEWKVFDITAGATRRNWYVIRHGGIDFSDAGFWLSQAQYVEARGGSYELRCSGNTGKIEIRNTKGEFRWFDRIDSNPSPNDPWYFRLLETANQVPESLTGSAFDVQIDWQDNRNEVRELE